MLWSGLEEMSDCGYTWPYPEHDDHRCFLNDDHTAIYPDSSSKRGLYVHLCRCGAWFKEGVASKK